jgi:glucose/arabinose dehydrogenase
MAATSIARPGLPALAGALLLALATGGPAHATLTARLVNSQLDHPVFMTTTPGNTVVAIVQQGGLIRAMNETGTLNGAPFLDLTAKVAYGNSDEERGLLGLAFPPDHALTGLFYVYYVADVGIPNDPGVITIAEYRVSSNPLLADPNSERILLRASKPVTGVPEEYHNGGTIAFGPDGLLYAALGDGQGFNGNDPNNCAQTDATPFGKLIRFNPAAIPPGGIVIGPAACPGPVDPLLTVVGKGLRNPYRFSFDSQTGDLFIGDVGQDLVEEVDAIPSAAVTAGGLNFGWRVMEGDMCNIPDPPPSPACFAGSLTPPAFAYVHTSGGVCDGTVIGGVVYRGAIPALQGQYLFADYCHGAVFTAGFDGSGSLTNVTDVSAQLLPDVGTIDNPTGFGVDGFGEVYLVDSPALGGNGEIFKILQVEPEPQLPADMGMLSASGLLPSFTAYPGAQFYFQFEFSTDPVGFTNSVLNKKKAKLGATIFLKKKTWKQVQALGPQGTTIYWRVIGKTAKKALNSVTSTTVHSFTIGP